MSTPQESDHQDRAIPAPPPLTDSELRGAGPVGLPPGTVQLSFLLWVVEAILAIVSALLLFTQRDTVRDAIRQQPNADQLTSAEIDTLVTTSLVFGVVVAAIVAVLFLLFAVKARAGRNWARIVLVVLAVLTVGWQAAGGGGYAAIGAVIIAIVAAVLLFLPQSNEYYAAAKRPR